MVYKHAKLTVVLVVRRVNAIKVHGTERRHVHDSNSNGTHYKHHVLTNCANITDKYRSIQMLV